MVKRAHGCQWSNGPAHHVHGPGGHGHGPGHGPSAGQTWPKGRLRVAGPSQRPGARGPCAPAAAVLAAAAVTHQRADLDNPQKRRTARGRRPQLPGCPGKQSVAAKPSRRPRDAFPARRPAGPPARHETAEPGPPAPAAALRPEPSGPAGSAGPRPGSPRDRAGRRGFSRMGLGRRRAWRPRRRRVTCVARRGSLEPRPAPPAGNRPDYSWANASCPAWRAAAMSRVSDTSSSSPAVAKPEPASLRAAAGAGPAGPASWEWLGR
jgi:hypothetical protein